MNSLPGGSPPGDSPQRDDVPGSAILGPPSAWPADNPPSQRWPIYSRGNIGEVYPNVVLPLEWDVGGLAAERGWRDGACRIGFLAEKDFGDEDFVMIGVFNGYAYFNASVMRLLGVRTPGLDVSVIDTQFLGSSPVNIAHYSPKAGDRSLAAALRVSKTALNTLTARRVPLVDEMRSKSSALRARAPSLDALDEDLWSYIKTDFTESYSFFIASHVTITMKATIASGALTDLCQAKFDDPNLALSLTAGLGEIVSAEPIWVMWALANETNDADFGKAFKGFLARYGHRGVNELSFSGQDWDAFPEVALRAIDSMRGLDPSQSPQARSIVAAEMRNTATADARANLGVSRRRLDWAIGSAALWTRAREQSKNELIRATQLARHCYLELVRRCAERGGVSDSLGPMLLSETEFGQYLVNPPSMLKVIAARRTQYQHLSSFEPPFAFDAAAHPDTAPPLLHPLAGGSAHAFARPQPGQELLRGAAGSPGLATGRARVVTDPTDPAAIEPGEIIVARLTDPSWTPLFVMAAAVVVEVGAAMSHAMIVSRELGIPCVVGVVGATSLIADGAEMEVDGNTGTVRLVS